MNLLLSHPLVCVPAGETHEVFKGAPIDSRWHRKRKRVLYDLPIRLTMKQDLFAPDLLTARKRPPVWTKHFIDYIFFIEKKRARHSWHNRYKAEDLEYATHEIADSRLLCKNVNGIIYMRDIFWEMYPDAVFFGLIRNGLAMCEGYTRRGGSAKEFGVLYREVCEKITQDATCMKNYHLVRFEEILADPLRVLRGLYRLAGLDVTMVSRVRLQAKGIMDARGVHNLPSGFSDREVVWYSLDELQRHFEPNINENQIKRLSAGECEEFLGEAGDAMERLGYI